MISALIEFPVTSLWKRFKAFIIDTLILGLVGFSLGFVFSDVFHRMGDWGPLVGFVIAVAYYGFGNSVLFNGQTIGKRGIRIQVRDWQGEFLHLSSSMLRALVFVAPYFLLKFNLPALTGMTSLVQPWHIFFIFLLFFTFFFISANKPAKQGLHDLAAGSLVTATVAQEKTSMQLGVPRRTFMMAGGGIGVLLLIYFSFSFFGSEKFAEHLDLYNRICQVEGVRKAGVEYKTTVVNGDENTRTNSLEIKVWLGYLPEDYNQLRDSETILSVLGEILRTSDLPDESEVINLVFVDGYDIGIASSTTSSSFGETRSYWEGFWKGNYVP